MTELSNTGTLNAVILPGKICILWFEIVCSMFRLRFDFLDLMYMNESV